MKKRIGFIIFMIVGTILGMIAFVVGLYVIKFLLDNPIILAILFALTIVNLIKEYFENI